MKISNETLAILKNFASIQKGILITPGNQLRTRTESVLAEAVVAEEFPVELGIYDLNNFLNVISLFRDPDLDFGETSLRIAETDGKAETNYAYAGAGLVTMTAKKKKRELPADVIEFVLTEEQWATTTKAVSVFAKPEVRITSDGNTVRLGTMDHKHAAGNAYSMVLDSDTHSMKCNMVFAMEHMRLLKGSYAGTVTPTYTVFKNTSGLDLTYFIGAEPTTSVFGDGE